MPAIETFEVDLCQAATRAGERWVQVAERLIRGDQHQRAHCLSEDTIADVQQAAQGLALKVLGVGGEELAGVLEHHDPVLASAIHSAVDSAFFQGFHAANCVAAGIAAAGAVIALALLPAQPTTSRDDTLEVPAPGTPATAAAHS